MGSFKLGLVLSQLQMCTPKVRPNERLLLTMVWGSQLPLWKLHAATEKQDLETP